MFLDLILTSCADACTTISDILLILLTVSSDVLPTTEYPLGSMHVELGRCHAEPGIHALGEMQVELGAKGAV